MSDQSNVISLDEHRPHLAGKARCIDCKHDWVAVAPVGTRWLECPKCHTEHGRYFAQVERDGPHWHCACECDLFYITPEGAYCPNCGEWQKGFE